MKSHIPIKLLAASAISLAAVFLFSGNRLEKAELAFYDWRINSASTAQNTPAPIVIVGVTENFETKTGKPLSRGDYASLLRTLRNEGASVTGFDIFFPQITDAKVDGKFIEQIKASGNVVLPVFSPVKISGKSGIYTALARGSSPEFNKAALSLGHINTLPDGDQVIRRIPARIHTEKRGYAQLSLEMARIFSQKNKQPFPPAGIPGRRKTMPVNKDGSLYVNFLPPEELLQYFIPFEDVLTGDYPPGQFKNKAVLVGQTTLGSKNADLVPTARGTQFGVMLQANILHNALSSGFIYRPARKAVFPFILLAGAVLGIIMFSAGTAFNTAFFACVSGLLVIVPLHAMRRYGIFLDAVPFLLLAFFLYFASVLQSLVNAVKKLLLKEKSLKIMRDAEKEIAEILYPTDMQGIAEGMFVGGVEGAELIKQTPGITIRTLLASLGIEAGALIMLSNPAKYILLAERGLSAADPDMKKIARHAFNLKQPFMAGNLGRKNEWGPGVKNVLLLPVLTLSEFKIAGVFINKSPSPFSSSSSFSRDDIPLIESLAIQAAVAIQNSRLNLALNDTQKESIVRLSVAIEYRDRETGSHIHRMSEYSKLIAINAGLGKSEAELIQNAMPLHDIGKIAIPDNILLKPGKLSADERKEVEKHPVIGAQMLSGSDALLLKAAEIIALSHHEKYDGSGYPFGLTGVGIPLYGRIAAIADVFDAMSSKRVYKEASSAAESFDFLQAESGMAFDRKMVSAFLHAREEVLNIMETCADVRDGAGK